MVRTIHRDFRLADERRHIDGTINRASGAYTFTIDPAKFQAGVLAGGEAFLKASVNAMR